MLRFLLAESDVDGRGQGHARLAPGRHLCPDLGERVMRMSSTLAASSAVAILSTALLCSFTGAAMSQTTPGSALPSVTIEAPRQVARPQRAERSQGSGRVAHRGRTSRSTQSATRTAPPAPGSVMARLKELERTSSNCTDGCNSSFKYGNQPWNGCSVSGAEFGHSVTCRNVRNYKTYYECNDTTQFLGWRNADAWWYCTSLLAGGKLAGEKFVEMRTLRY